MAKELQDFFPNSRGPITVAKIFYIKTVYIYEDGHEEITNMNEFYSSYKLAEDGLNFYETHPTISTGVKDVKRTIETSYIEIKLYIP